MNTAKFSAALLAMMLMPALLHAQPAAPRPPAPPARPAQGGARGGDGIAPGQFQQEIMDLVRQKLEATDEQWKSIEPRLVKVREAQSQLRSGAGMGIGRGAGAGAARIQAAPDVDTPLGHAVSDLRAALEDKDVATDDLVKKMAAVREAREKAREEVRKAQEELKATLTPRQEAMLMTLGQLD
jgi:Spy/CpxP family protein refolding chaperone